MQSDSEAISGMVSEVRDFTGDGIDDVWASGNNRSQLYVGQGDGTFTPGVSFTFSGSAATQIVADFNGDGLPDYAATANFGAPIEVLTNQGNGNFTRSFFGGLYFVYGELTTGDFNGDGKMDLVVADSGTGSTGFTVLNGNGDGTFSVGQSVVYGSGLYTGATYRVDFNRDGIDDLLTTSDNALRLHLGTGTGLGAGTTIPTPYYGGALIGDLNNDGLDDFFYARGGGATGAVVYLQQQDGSFQQVATAGVGIGALDVQLVDIDSDGDLDAVSGSYSGTGGVSVALNNGAGVFGTPTVMGDGVFGARVNVTDIDGDGKYDLVAKSPTGLYTLFGNGDGSFRAPVSSAATLIHFRELFSGDFNRDGITDFVSSNHSENTITFHLGVADTTRRVTTIDGTDYSVATQTTARQSLDRAKLLRERLSREQGALGASLSRLDAIASTVRTQRDEYLAAESRIKDTDIAAESAEQVRLSILQQSAAAVLGQANLGPQIALRLLGRG